MPWIFTQPKPAKHECAKPDAGETQNRQPGDIWQCRQCSTKWKLTRSSVVDEIEMWVGKQPAWERVSG